VFRHYAREFDRSRREPGRPLADVLTAARAEVSGPFSGTSDATVLQRVDAEPVSDSDARGGISYQ